MIITSIELHNWQPYYGFGQKGKTRVNFKGKSGKKNIIFYGQNTNGKTAFWEAIQFSFFDFYLLAETPENVRYQD